MAGSQSNRIALSSLIVLSLSICTYADIYTSVQWTPHNPVLNCSNGGVPEMGVIKQSSLPIICPNLNIIMSPLTRPPDKSTLYENLWIVYDEHSFQTCNITTKNSKNRQLIQCDSPNVPSALKYYTVTFLENAATAETLVFVQGKYYYFTATSDGTEGSLNNTEGGHCKDTGAGFRMKFKVYLCKDNEDNDEHAEKCNPANVGKLQCPTVNTTSNTTTPTTTITPQPPQTIAPTTITGTTTLHSEGTSTSPTENNKSPQLGASTGNLDSLKIWKIFAGLFLALWVLTMLFLFYACYRYKLRHMICFTDIREARNGKVSNSACHTPVQQHTGLQDPRDPAQRMGYDNPSFDNVDGKRPADIELKNKGDDSLDEGVSMSAHSNPSNGTGDLSNTPSDCEVIGNANAGADVPNKSNRGDGTKGNAIPQALTDDEKVSHLRNSGKLAPQESGEKQKKKNSKKTALPKLKGPSPQNSNSVVLSNKGAGANDPEAELRGHGLNTPEMII